MSPASSSNTSPANSPVVSPAISLDSTLRSSVTSSPADSLYGIDIYPRRPSWTSNKSSCAFPSWPNRDSLYSKPIEAASSYISDDDLFPDVFEDEGDANSSASSEQRNQTRTNTQAPISMELINALNPMPWCASSAPKQTKQRRRSSRKVRRTSKPMSPISEGPE
ncbi:MAG: hypothetical protein M1819_004439 [Sarea resinae]|nr:MAG: hypothetical protein M1819_004439 [Sarea resinae]